MTNQLWIGNTVCWHRFRERRLDNWSCMH